MYFSLIIARDHINMRVSVTGCRFLYADCKAVFMYVFVSRHFARQPFKAQWLCTTRFNVRESYVPRSVCCVHHRTNSDFVPLRH
jgi:hypothetical protein